MASKDFSAEAVRSFILENGGRVTNQQLVTYFKHALNDPVHKDQNRAKFKEFVNTVANIKVNEKKEKLLVLKKKFRPDASSSSLASMASSSGSDSQSNSTQSLNTQSQDRARSEPPDQSQAKPDSVPLTTQSSDSNISKYRSEGSLPIGNVTQSGSPVKVKTTPSNQDPSPSPAEVIEEVDLSVFSVKDRAKHLNKIESETELQKAPAKKRELRIPKDGGDTEDDASSTSYIELEPIDREWLVTCSQADYHPMNTLLSKNPGLTRLKTALHWAAKHGKPEVVKMVASSINVNQRSGYTPLHLAAMQGHEEVIELLVSAYKADINIRDFSGKKAKQYLRHSISQRAQQLLLSSRLSRKQGTHDHFAHSTVRKSSRAQALSALIKRPGSSYHRRWMGSTEDITDGDKVSPKSTPTSSRETSPHVQLRRRGSFDDKALMPPPSGLMHRKKTVRSEVKENLSSSQSDPNLMRPRSRDTSV